jgi:hypothetical protein
MDSQREVSHHIAKYLAEEFRGKKDPDPLFVGNKEPPISFPSYVERLIKLTNKWAEENDGQDSFGVRCAVLAVEYLERVDVNLDSKAIHRYFTSAYLISIKLLFDFYMSNSYWAKVSGLPHEQVNRMEAHICNCLNWDFHIPEKHHDDSIRKFVPSL